MKSNSNLTQASSREDGGNPQKTPGNYTYCVMPGNYPATMRAVMTKRGNWTEVLLSLTLFESDFLRRCNRVGLISLEACEFWIRCKLKFPIL